MGFDADRDIEAITINRWSHGYAYGYRDLYDPEWPEGEAPHELGRKPLGRISIAGSDSEARPYLDAAVDAAWRAVKEPARGVDRSWLESGHPPHREPPTRLEDEVARVGAFTSERSELRSRCLPANASK